MVVEKGSFAMSNVEITRRLGGETCDNLTFNGILQDASIGSILLLKVESRREDSLFDELSCLMHLDC